MRTLAALLGFSAGAYLMWSVAGPVPEAAPSCRPASACQGPTAMAKGLPSERSLSIVLYDPNADLSPAAD